MPSQLANAQSQLVEKERELRTQFGTELGRAQLQGRTLRARLDTSAMETGKLLLRFFEVNTVEAQGVEGVVEIALVGQSTAEAAVAARPVEPKVRVVAASRTEASASGAASVTAPLREQRGDQITFAELLSVQPRQLSTAACSEAQLNDYIQGQLRARR